MPILGRYEQSPNDAELYTVDYSDWLDQEPGEILTAFDVVSWSPTDTVAPIFTAGPAYLDSTTLKGILKITGGQVGQVYEVIVRATSNAGRIVNDCIEITIEGPCNG